jgi:Icc-related predicted phosphoesterase
MQTDHRVTRIAALGDLHVTETPPPELRPLLEQITASADVLVLCGDLTDQGLVSQGQTLAKELVWAVSKVPTVAVLGNHDYESGHGEEIRALLSTTGVNVLDGEACEVGGIGFAGVKGFCGGFGRATLNAFGEPAIKAFVHACVEEALKLETALQRLRTPHRIAVLHYSPIRATCEGEPLEIFAYLGCSRLEEPLNRFKVTAAVHGHAHRGALEAKTTTGVPVYNVSMPLLKASFPNRPAFRLLTLPKVEPLSHPPPEEAPVETPVAESPESATDDESDLHVQARVGRQQQAEG